MRWAGCVEALLAVAVVTGCASELPAAQLAWCAQHQDEVARSALTHGLMEDGESYAQWKAGQAGAYREACATAFQARVGS